MTSELRLTYLVLPFLAGCVLAGIYAHAYVLAAGACIAIGIAVAGYSASRGRVKSAQLQKQPSRVI